MDEEVPLRLLEDEDDDEVSGAAIWSLSQIGGEDVRTYLENLLDQSEDEEQTEFLEEALDNLSFTEDRGIGIDVRPEPERQMLVELVGEIDRAAVLPQLPLALGEDRVGEGVELVLLQRAAVDLPQCALDADVGGHIALKVEVRGIPLGHFLQELEDGVRGTHGRSPRRVRSPKAGAT